METLVLLSHLETVQNRFILGTLFPEDLLKLYLNSVTIMSRQKSFDEQSQLRWTVAQEKPGGQIFSQEGAGGVGAIVATTLPKKSYERFYSQMKTSG